MTSHDKAVLVRDDEIDLRAVFVELWRGKWIILLFVVLFAAIGVGYALSKPNFFRANALLVPAHSDSRSGGAGQLGGLASLAGIDLGGSNKTSIALEVLKSRSFLAEFIHRHGLSIPLAASEGWDFEKGDWRINRSIYDKESGRWGITENGVSRQPSDWVLVKKLRARLSVTERKNGGMLTLSVKSLSPVAAKEWVELLVRDVNDYIRSQDIAESEARIAYLEEKLSETSVGGMQQVFYQLIEQETRTVMLANARAEYIFKTIDPAVVPEEKSEPNRPAIVSTAATLGGAFGIVSVFLLSYFRRPRAR